MDSSLQLEGYTWINFNRSVKHVRAPKPSGSVGLFIKQSLLQEYNVSTLDKTVDGILIVQFKHKYTDFTFVVCACYFSPENSTWGSNATAWFAHLMAMLYTCNYADAIFDCGDFNARIGKENDIIHNIDSVAQRVVLDQTKNPRGDVFTDFLKDMQLCVVNGRVTTQNDNFTFVSTRGRSVVDYIVTHHD